MDRHEAVKNAYKDLGGEATFYDGMITCSTLPGKAVCKLVWDMGKRKNDRYLELALSGIPKDFSGRMLEVPVGTGVLTMPVYEGLPDADITCLDYSADMMERAMRQFFLMEHETYGKEAAWIVLDEDGELIVDNVYRGFDQTVLQQIKDYLNPTQNVTELQVQKTSSGNSKEKQPLENWQKYMENGEYLRNIESGEEQNYSFIDGNKNNGKKKNGRVSVLKKLRQKQAEIAKRSGKPAQQMEATADMERRRK